MKLLTLIFLAIGLISTHGEEQFRNSVADNYQYYQEVITEETSAVRITVFLGLIGEQYSLSIYYENVSAAQNHYLQLVDQNKTSNLTSSSNKGVFYQRKVKAGSSVELKVVSSKQSILFKSYQIDIPSAIPSFKEIAIQGKGLNDFPASSWSLSLSTLLFIGVLVFFGISLIFAIVILIVFKKKKGIFSHQAQAERRSRFEYIEVDSEMTEEEELDNNYKLDPKDYKVENTQPDYEDKTTKEEKIDELFKAYKAGKISERALNAALRAVWAEDEDDDN